MKNTAKKHSLPLRIIYLATGAILFALPIIYSATETLKINNTTTKMEPIIGAVFFTIFWALSALAVIQFFLKDNGRPKVKRSAIVWALDIIGLIALAANFVLFCIFYNKVFVIVILGSGLLLAINAVNIFKKEVDKNHLWSAVALVLIFVTGASFILAKLVPSGYEYKKQLNHLSAMGYTAEYDEYGGWANYPAEWGQFPATGFFYTQKIAGRWWFINPIGNPFISKGVNDVSIDYNGETIQKIMIEKHGSRQAWGDAAIDFLWDLGFNTVTSWSSAEVMSNRMPYTILLNAGDIYRKQKQVDFADYFEQDYVESARTTIAQNVRPDDPLLLGYFTDNELVWGSDWKGYDSATEVYLGFSTEGRNQIIAHLKESVSSIEEFNRIFKTKLNSMDDIENLKPQDIKINVKNATEEAKKIDEDFAEKVARRYASVIKEILDELDSNHLNLGCRLAVYPGMGVIRGLVPYFDVMSYAGYGAYYYVTWDDNMRLIYEEFDIPFLLEEFGVRALDMHQPNINFSGSVVLNQSARSVLTSVYLEEFMYQPFAIGYHWYKYADNQHFGLLRGENYGIIDIYGREYTKFNTMFRALNNNIETIHTTENGKHILNVKKYHLWG